MQDTADCPYAVEVGHCTVLGNGAPKRLQSATTASIRQNDASGCGTFGLRWGRHDRARELGWELRLVDAQMRSCSSGSGPGRPIQVSMPAVFLRCPFIGRGYQVSP